MFSTTEGEILVAVASDGAGSAVLSRQGAALACDMFIAEVDSILRSGGSIANLQKDFIESLLQQLHVALAYEAHVHETTIRELACTLSGAIVGSRSAVFVQVGDGVTIVDDSDCTEEYAYITWPQSGEYVNTTHFLTDAEVRSRASIELVRRRVDELAIMTDGLTPLALNMRARTVYSPFFRPLFEMLRTKPFGASDSTSLWLKRFLGSRRVNSRVTDDKTLILATRRLDVSVTP